MKVKKLFGALLLSVVTLLASGANQSFAAYDSYFVYNERDFKIAASGARDTDYIIFGSDVYLSNNVKLNSSVTLDLNGYTLYVLNNNAAVHIGDKVFDHTEKYTVTKPGYFSYEKKKRIIEHPDEVYMDDDGDIYIVPQDDTIEYITERVWHPATEEVRYKDIYKYYDNVDIIIKNGKIVHKDGVDGKDGEQNTWSNYNGKDGVKPSEPIKMISGTVRFENILVYAGNGGNGGNGSYQSLIHVPFGGGSGGNGGNGADGGNVIAKYRNECKIVIGNNVELIPGEGGIGGKMSKANSNYWIYRGWNGDNGKNGDEGVKVHYGLESDYRY